MQPVIVLAPDSFKGSLSARAACEAMAQGILRVTPALLRKCPMADGGEGTLDALLAHGGMEAQLEVSGAGGHPRSARYGSFSDELGELCVIEIAQVVGITDSVATRAPVQQRSSLGVGTLIRERLDAGIRRFTLALGGSSTNDGGAGMLAALGLELLDAQGSLLAPTPEALHRLVRVSAGELDPRLRECRFEVWSDVENPLFGPTGAAAVYGPQKGLGASEIPVIDDIIQRYATLTEAALGVSAAHLPGAGAAGGLGFAALLLGGQVRSGARAVAERCHLPGQIEGAQWVLTGEGRSDEQTLFGKAPVIVAMLGRAAGVPVSLLSGSIEQTALARLNAEFSGCFALPDGPMDLSSCVDRASQLLADRSEQLMRLWLAARSSTQS